MDYFKKKKIQKWFRTHWRALVWGGAFLTVGAVALIIGMSMCGWDFVKWIKSVYGLTTMISLIVGIAGYAFFAHMFKMREIMK